LLGASLWVIEIGPISIATSLVTENIPMPIMWRLIFFFNHHAFVDLGRSIDSGLMSTIDLATKFGLLSNKM